MLRYLFDLLDLLLMVTLRVGCQFTRLKNFTPFSAKVSIYCEVRKFYDSYAISTAKFANFMTPYVICLGKGVRSFHMQFSEAVFGGHVGLLQMENF